ncbi:hypothetical protein [Cellulomonas taurus]|uniref:hypothetical protein n=1 Tax=Cellulomonas taurus TaxID=2729175 RepID=UPI00145C43F4|nr:hypothetical protein [Cellulomonas taurus]
MTDTLAATRLHLNKREMTFVVPLGITGLVALISVLIMVLLIRAGQTPGTDAWVEGARSNGGMLWGLCGFIGYMGVQSVATTFPFALTLGATRRHFVFGTVLWWAITSAYLAAIFTVLLAIELATGHWFADFYIFDVFLLGSGSLAKIAVIVFLGSMSIYSLGGVFAASWVRFRNRGPIVLGTALVLAVLVVLILAVPSFRSIVEAFRAWWLIVAAVAVIAGSSIGTWAFLRGSSVR